MHDAQELIRKFAADVLSSGEAEVVIGYEEGTIPLTARPAFVTKPEEAGRLVWNGLCAPGLSRYVQEYIAERRKRRDYDAAKAKKVAVVASPCDERALVSYLKENQFTREEIYVIGVNCAAPLIDRGKVLEAVGPFRLRAATLEKDAVLATTTAGEEIRFDGQAVMDETCAGCDRRTVLHADVVVGEPSPDTVAGSRFGRVLEQEGRSADDRWAWFAGEFARCIRCYACRQACPVCYCEECFADQRNPPWIGAATAEEDVLAFHIVRAFHTAGRCAECGACERACPMAIPVRVLADKLVKDVSEIFAYDVGASLDEKPPLSTYKPDDPNEGFL